MKAFLFKLIIFLIIFCSFCNLKIFAAKHFVYNGQSIQKVIDKAQNGDKIVVLPGKYYESLEIKNKNIMLKAKGGHKAVKLHGNSSKRILYIAGKEITSDTLIKGFKFVKGYTDTNGGAIQIYGKASPRIFKCVFKKNRSDLDGGAISIIKGSQAVIENCTFKRNSAYLTAGALYVYNASPTINNCKFTSNTANEKEYIQGDWQNSNGGAIHSAGANSTITIINSTFKKNEANILGGAIMLSTPSGGTISNNEIIDNYAIWHGAGIAINNYSSTDPVLIENNNISNNICNVMGAGIYTEGAIIQIINNQVNNNSAINETGIDTKHPSIVNTSVGGVCCWNCQGSVENNTLNGNTAHHDPHLYIAGGGTVTSNNNEIS